MIKNKLIFFISLILMTNLHSKLVNLKKIIPDIELDIRYATKDNFTKKQIYDEPEAYLLENVAQALKQVNNELKPLGYKLKVFDAYRPISAQRKMWQAFPDERYVLNPDKGGGRHTRGTTVDLTLVKLDGSEVKMPTEFDCFEETAHSDYKNLPQEIINNRELLKYTMKKYGFCSFEYEWWHFDYKNWQDFPPLDIKFSEIE